MNLAPIAVPPDVRIRLQGIFQLTDGLRSPPSVPASPDTPKQLAGEEWYCSWCSTLNLGGQCCINAKCLRDRHLAGVAAHEKRRREAPDRLTSPTPARQKAVNSPVQYVKIRVRGCVAQHNQAQYVKLRVRGRVAQHKQAQYVKLRVRGRVASAAADHRQPLATLPELYRVVEGLYRPTEPPAHMPTAPHLPLEAPRVPIEVQAAFKLAAERERFTTDSDASTSASSAPAPPAAPPASLPSASGSGSSSW